MANIPVIAEINTLLDANDLTIAKAALGVLGAATTGNASIVAGDIAAGAVIEAKILDGAVTAGKIGTGAVTAGKLATSAVDLTTSTVTGTLPVNKGGTGAATLAANNVLLGNGTTALQVVAPSTSGSVLTSNGSTWVSSLTGGTGTALYEDFSRFPNGTIITRDSNATTGYPKIGNPYRYSLTATTAPFIEDGALICAPAVGGLVYFGNDVGETIRSMSFEVDWRKTETLTSSPAPGAITFAFHTNPVLNVNADGILLPEGMLHIQCQRSGIVDFGYGYTQGVNFSTIRPYEAFANGTSYWSDDFVTGNIPYRSKFIINFQFIGDTCIISAFGKTHTYRHPVIAQYPPRHWFYETSGNLASVFDYPRLHRFWANSPIMSENPILAQSDNLKPQLIGETINHRAKNHIFNSNTDLRCTLTIAAGQNALATETVSIGGKAQIEYLNYSSAITTSGTLPVSITGVGITGTRIINVAVAAGDSAAAVLTKIATALNADTEFSSQWSMVANSITRLSPGSLFKIQDDTFVITTPQVLSLSAAHRAHITSNTQRAIETRVYTFVASPSAVDEVKIGANATATRDNLIAAINAGLNIGTIYGVGTRGNADHSAFLVGTTALQVVANSRVQTMVVSETMSQGSWGTVLNSTEFINGGVTGDILFNANVGVSGRIRAKPTANDDSTNVILRGKELLNPVVSAIGSLSLLTTLGGNRMIAAGDYDEMIVPLYFPTTNSKTIRLDLNGAVGNSGATTGGLPSTYPLEITFSDTGYGWLHLIRIYNNNGADQIYVKFQTDTVTKIGYGNYNFNNGFGVRVLTTTTATGDVVVCGNPSKLSVR